MYTHRRIKHKTHTNHSKQSTELKANIKLKLHKIKCQQLNVNQFFLY